MAVELVKAVTHLKLNLSDQAQLDQLFNMVVPLLKGERVVLEIDI